MHVGNPERPDAADLLKDLRAHLDAGIMLAKQGAAAAERNEHEAVRQLFQGCVRELEHTSNLVHSLGASLGSGPVAAQLEPGEQVSAASFAPGDGANDAQVTPEEARGKPGNWPAY